MKQSLLLVFCSSLLLAGNSSMAQSLSKKWSIGFGLEAGTPVGDTKESYKFTGGLTARFSYKAGPGFAIFETGAVAFYPKKVDGEKAKAGLQIPFKVGYKWILMDHLFVMGELGYSSFRYYSEDNNSNLVSYGTGGFTYAPEVGVQFGFFEVGVKYEGVAVSGGTLSNVALRLGFNF